VSPKKPKLHTKKRPSLARAVMDRQHRRSLETASPRMASTSLAGKRSVSLGSTSGASSSGGPSRVLGEGGKHGNAATTEAPKRKSSSLTAGTAASLARSAKKPEGTLRSQPKKAAAWR
jgi:hypothetical protein